MMQQGGGGYPGGGPGYPGGPPGGGYPPGPPGGGYPGGPGGPIPTGTTKVGNLTYNVAALLCYLPIFGISIISSILWLITEPPESKFVRFHAIQSLTFIGVTFGLMVGLGCCSGFMVPMAASAGGQSGAEIGGVIAIVLGLFQLAYLGVWLILHVWLMVKAYNNEAWKVPLIGNLAASSTGIGG